MQLSQTPPFIDTSQALTPIDTAQIPAPLPAPSTPLKVIVTKGQAPSRWPLALIGLAVLTFIVLRRPR